jgi:proteasome lid subunit RPN8/RPN11
MRDGRALATPGAIEAFRAHAVEAYPCEALGFINPWGHYERLRNVAREPTKHAVPDKNQLGLLIAKGNVRALCHSHPGGPDCPSELDARTQQDMDLPFVICSTNGQATTEPFCWGDDLLDTRPLVGRTFRHLTDDCYALIRAYWLLTHGVLLPDFPRGWEWWGKGYGGETDLYRRFFGEAGFHQIDAADARPGDVWMAAVRSDMPNHAGVFQENGLALHHPSSGLPHDPTRLSRREPLARWNPYIVQWVRRP